MDGQILLHQPELVVPGTGALDLRVTSGAPPQVTSSGESPWRTCSKTMSFASRSALTDRSSHSSTSEPSREVFSGPGNDLRMFDDLPAAWEAWNLTDTSRTTGEPIANVESIEVVEHGPLRVALQVRRRYGSSSILQTYQLRAGSARLDIVTEIDWHERRKMLRAMFPLIVRSDFATFETCFGAVRRPTHRNTSWDTARFEVPAHRWADLSEAGYGFSLLNDGRYGHSALGSTLGLTLLRSPLDPDPLADLGRHTFTYSIYPHSGAWHEAETVQEAIDLNSPLVGRTMDAESQQAGAGRQWFKIDGLTLAALKFAEEDDDLILRLYDPYGRHGTATIRPDIEITRASLTNVLEEEIDRVESDPTV